MSEKTSLQFAQEIRALQRDGSILHDTMVPCFEDLFFRNDRFKTVRYALLPGGRGSGKTKSMCQYLCYLMLTQKGMVFVISRKYGPSLIKTVYEGSPSILETLNEWGIIYKLNRSNKTLKVNGNTVYFISLDEGSKIKSMNVNYVWMEEANEFSWKDFQEFDAICRSPNKYGQNQIYITFNPSKYYNWTVQVFLLNPIKSYKEKSGYWVSTPLNNPYLPYESKMIYIRQGESDPALMRCNVLGEPSMPQGLVYTHFKVMPEESWDERVWHTQPYYGVDFGYEHFMVIIEGRLLEDTWYLRELFFKNHKTVQQMVEYMEEVNEGWKAYVKPTQELYPDEYDDQLDLWNRGRFVPRMSDYLAYGKQSPKDMIPRYFDHSGRYWCDHQPDQYRQLMNGGYYVELAHKDNIVAGIMTVKSHRVIISADSTGTLGQIQTYQWMEPKGSDTFAKDAPIKENDDSCDAIRYIIHSYYNHRPGGYYVGNTTKLKDPDSTEAKAEEKDRGKSRYVYVPSRGKDNYKM